MKKLQLAIWGMSLLFMCCGSSGSKVKDIGRQEADYDSAVSQSELETPNKVKNSSSITLAVVGDIMMGTTYPENNLTADDGASLFKDADSILRRVDIAAGNLEGSLFDGKGQPKRCGNPNSCFTFKMPTRYSKYLVDAGFDFVSIANNHINDFGPEAIESTQKVLTDAGIAFAGVAAKCPTTVIEKDGRKIGFAAFGFNPGMPSINNPEEVKSIVRGLRDKCDILVVSFHGGGEGVKFQHVPHGREIAFGQDRGDVEKFAHTAVDAGADMVFGHSPHVTRAMELYNDRLILYSLGNFCTPYKFNISGVNGYAPIVEMTLNSDGTFAEGQIHSFIQQRGVGPRWDSSNIVAKNMRKLTQEDFPSTPLDISDTGKITRK